LNIETGFRIGVDARAKVRSIEIVLSCYSNQSEQRVPSRISERRSHAARGCRLGDWAHWPFRRQRNTLKRAIYDNKIN
jgi:hypothetical protein